MSNGFCNHFIMKGRLMSWQRGFTIQFKTFSFYSLILWGILGIISSSILKIFQEASQKCSLKPAYKNIYPEFHASLTESESLGVDSRASILNKCIRSFQCTPKFENHYSIIWEQGNSWEENTAKLQTYNWYQT